MNKSYLAGIIDGEGTIGFSHRKKKNVYVPYIAIANTNAKLIYETKTFLLSCNINSVVTRKKPIKIHHKVCYTLRCIYNNAIRLAILVQDDLIIKKEQSFLLTKDHVQSTNRNGRYTKNELKIKNNIYRKMSSLNSRGVVKATHENSL